VWLVRFPDAICGPSPLARRSLPRRPPRRLQSAEARTTGFTIDKDGAVMVQGWAADGTTKTAAVAACLLVDGKVVPAATATYGTARPDVATAYSLPAMGATGFMLTFGTSGLARGKHAISVAGVTTRGATALSSVDTVVVP
jgi:hypothetical protein